MISSRRGDLQIAAAVLKSLLLDQGG